MGMSYLEIRDMKKDLKEAEAKLEKMDRLVEKNPYNADTETEKKIRLVLDGKRGIKI